MNLAFYVDSLNGSPVNLEIFNLLNSAVEENKIENGSVFYDNIDFNPVPPKFGTFNGTDLWYFTGKLITTSRETFISASNVVNKFKTYFLFSGEKNAMSVVEISNQTNIITRSKEDSDYIKRVTGKDSVLVENLNLEKLLEVLG